MTLFVCDVMVLPDPSFIEHAAVKV